MLNAVAISRTSLRAWRASVIGVGMQTGRTTNKTSYMLPGAVVRAYATLKRSKMKKPTGARKTKSIVKGTLLSKKRISKAENDEVEYTDEDDAEARAFIENALKGNAQPMAKESSRSKDKAASSNESGARRGIKKIEYHSEVANKRPATTDRADKRQNYKARREDFKRKRRNENDEEREEYASHIPLADEDQARAVRLLRKNNKLSFAKEPLYDKTALKGKKTRLELLRERIALEKSGGDASLVNEASKPIEYLDDTEEPGASHADDDFDYEELYPKQDLEKLARGEIDEDDLVDKMYAPKKKGETEEAGKGTSKQASTKVQELRRIKTKGGITLYSTKTLDRARLEASLRKYEGSTIPIYVDPRAALNCDWSRVGKYSNDVSALEERLKELGVELGNKITMLQSFENAVVGRYVQPMNLNLHHHGLAFLELKIVEHLVLNFPNIPRRKMIVLLNETLSIDVLGLCAMELNLVKFTKLIPDVPLSRFGQAELSVRKTMSANAFTCLVGAVYRDKGTEAAAELVKKPKALLLKNYNIPKLMDITMDTASRQFGIVANELRLDRPYWVDYGSGPKNKLQALYSGKNLLGRGQSQDVWEARRKAAIEALLNYYGYDMTTPGSTKLPKRPRVQKKEPKKATKPANVEQPEEEYDEDADDGIFIDEEDAKADFDDGEEYGDEVDEDADLDELDDDMEVAPKKKQTMKGEIHRTKPKAKKPLSSKTKSSSPKSSSRRPSSR